MAISWKWMLVALMAASLVVIVFLIAPGEVGATQTNEPLIGYDELTRLIGPVAN